MRKSPPAKPEGAPDVSVTLGQDATALDLARVARSLTVDGEADGRVLSLRGDERQRWIRGAIERATEDLQGLRKLVRKGEELVPDWFTKLARDLIALHIVVEATPGQQHLPGVGS